MKRPFFIAAACAALAASVLALKAGVAEEKKPWTDFVTMSGDFRFRYEFIDEQDKEERNRARLRVRLGTAVKAADDLDLYFRLATNIGGDPVSTNVTLGDGMGGKEFRLDRGYFDWHPANEVGETHVFGGKMANPFIMPADLIWDFDLNPEGLAASQSVNLTQALKLIANGAAFQVQERSSEAETNIFGGQLAMEASASKVTRLLVGGGYYNYTSTEGKPLIFSPTNSFGNTTITDEDGRLLYASEFGEMEFFARLLTNIGLPAALYFDYVKNTRADTSLDTGWMVGATIGKAAEPGSWQLDYNYRKLEADAVLAVLTDSDSFGGGTDGKGHRIGGFYQLTKNVQLALTVFADKIDISMSDKDYTRTQLDVLMKF